MSRASSLSILSFRRAHLASTTTERDGAGVRPSSGAPRSAYSGLPGPAGGDPCWHHAERADGRTPVVLARCAPFRRTLVAFAALSTLFTADALAAEVKLDELLAKAQTAFTNGHKTEAL